MASASIPLIMMLRHILIAEATPSVGETTSGAKPSAASVGASAAASGPPISIGTRIP